MTFRAKPVAKRSHRPQWESDSRRHLYTNIAFGLVVVASVLILAAAAGASYYGDHLAAAAKVNGVTISKDQLRDLIAVQTWRLDQDEARIRTELANGRITQAEADQQLQPIQQQRQNTQQFVSRLFETGIDNELKAQLAAKNGITITDAQIDAQITKEATSTELRHVSVIAVKPEVSQGATEPTADQKAKAKAKAEAALAEVKSGKAFADVAKSTDPSATNGGDAGWINADNNSLDKSLSDALFKAQPKTPTDLIEGADGTIRFGEVTEIDPATVDPTYQQKITNANVSLAAYRAVVKSELIADALQTKIVADLTGQPSVQRHVLEIFVAKPSAPGDQVKARHILYSPNHDPGNAAKIAPNDPAWQVAKAEAQNTYDKLKALEGKPDQLAAQFADIAKKESDDKSSGVQGGDLDYFAKTDLDPTFADAIFKDGLKPGELLPPVKSQFGWHVIQFVDRRQGALERMTGLQLKAAGGADFAQLAKDNSEAAEKTKGGDIGWVARYQLDKQREDAIFGLKVGSVSDVITTNDGLYLFKVIDEQTRTADSEQGVLLKSDGFTNWYAAQKKGADIFRDPSFVSASSTSG